MKEETKDLKSLAEQALKLVDWTKYSANEDFVWVDRVRFGNKVKFSVGGKFYPEIDVPIHKAENEIRDWIREKVESLLPQWKQGWKSLT